MVSLVQLSRALCFVPMLLVSAVGLGKPAHAAEPIKVRMAVITTASTAAMLVGARKGIFKKHGFDVEVVPVGTGVQANQALASNQVEWSGGGIESTFVAGGTGLAFKPYAMYAKGGDAFGLLVRKDRNINRIEDLKGKTVAVTIGTALAQGLGQLLLSVGLPPDAAQRQHASLSGMGPMLVQGSVDAMVGLEPFLSLTKQQMGDDAVLLTRLGKYIQGGGFFLISDKWAEQHKDQLPKVIEAFWEAHHYVRHNKEEASAMVSEYIKAPKDVVDISFEYYDFNPVIDEFTLTSATRTVDYLVAEKAMPTKIDPKEYLADAQRIGEEIAKRRPDLLQ